MRLAASIALIAVLTPATLALAELPKPSVQTGIDVLAADGFKLLTGKRVGLITNATGVTWDVKSTADVLHAANNVTLVSLYGPEHGIRGNIFAGDHVADDEDPHTGLPVYSLYGKTRKATPEMLEGLDVLVYDIQDNGCRSYTYISTMALAMEAAAEKGIKFVVLDRPNPLTGNRVEGRPLDLKTRSFVGQLPIPYIYGMSCGELAQMVNGEGWLAGGIKCDLTVVPMKGWTREMWFEDTGLVWVPTSPHLPRADSALFYAATGIMGELQVLSEGVGYTMPFELVGAPFIDPHPFADQLKARNLPGVMFRPLYWKHYYLRDTKPQVGGVQVHLIDRNNVDLTAIQFHAIDIIQKMYPDQKFFGLKRDGMFDKVCGTDQIRKMFLEGKPAAEIVKFWNSGREDFMKARAKYLIYR